jgi:hypothetical protein
MLPAPLHSGIEAHIIMHVAPLTLERVPQVVQLHWRHSWVGAILARLKQ